VKCTFKFNTYPGPWFGLYSVATSMPAWESKNLGLNSGPHTVQQRYDFKKLYHMYSTLSEIINR
jgi:hypothetical protein